MNKYGRKSLLKKRAPSKARQFQQQGHQQKFQGVGKLKSFQQDNAGILRRNSGNRRQLVGGPVGNGQKQPDVRSYPKQKQGQQQFSNQQVPDQGNQAWSRDGAGGRQASYQNQPMAQAQGGQFAEARLPEGQGAPKVLARQQVDAQREKPLDNGQGGQQFDQDVGRQSQLNEGQAVRAPDFAQRRSHQVEADNVVAGPLQRQPVNRGMGVPRAQQMQGRPVQFEKSNRRAGNVLQAHSSSREHGARKTYRRVQNAPRKGLSSDVGQAAGLRQAQYNKVDDKPQFERQARFSKSQQNADSSYVGGKENYPNSQLLRSPGLQNQKQLRGNGLRRRRRN